MMTETDPAKVKPCLFCGNIGLEMHDGLKDGRLRFACGLCRAFFEIQAEASEHETFDRWLAWWNGAAYKEEPPDIKSSEKYFNLMSALADSVTDMTDEEIQEEIAETGDTAEETRNLLLNAIEFAIREAEQGGTK